MRWPLVILAIALTALAASAGTVGAERLITGADIKDGSITGRDVKRGTIGRTRLAQSARHRVFASKRHRGRQSSASLDGGDVQITTVTVPAGDYAVEAVFTIGSLTTGGMVMCWLSDTAGRLTPLATQQEWVTYDTRPPGQVYSPSSPMVLLGAATYSSTTTITVTCYSQPGLGEFYVGGAVLTAEQVELTV